MTDTGQGMAEIGDIAAKLQSGNASPALDAGSLLGHMSMTGIVISLFAGLVGSAYFMYGKKNCHIPAVVSGIALCVVPYFITNTLWLVVACIAMAAAPFVI
jgi:hypothetical protein